MKLFLKDYFIRNFSKKNRNNNCFVFVLVKDRKNYISENNASTKLKNDPFTPLLLFLYNDNNSKTHQRDERYKNFTKGMYIYIYVCVCASLPFVFASPIKMLHKFHIKEVNFRVATDKYTLCLFVR